MFHVSTLLLYSEDDPQRSGNNTFEIIFLVSNTPLSPDMITSHFRPRHHSPPRAKHGQHAVPPELKNWKIKKKLVKEKNKSKIK